MKAAVIVLILAAFIVPGLSQQLPPVSTCDSLINAPLPCGGSVSADVNCLRGFQAPNHIFPAEWRILMDTYDYQFGLFASGSGAFENVDLDGDGRTWSEVVGGICSWSLYSCTGVRNQNNWLFSSRICLEDSKEIFFNVSYRFTQCRDNPNCVDDFVTLYRYDTDTVVTRADRITESNYEPLFGSEIDSRFQQAPRPSRGGAETRSISRPLTDSFYLGVKDSGTCGQINRLIAYYTVCPSSQNELVFFPEFATPPKGGSDEIFDAKCVCNAHNVTSLQIKAFSRNSTCMEVAPQGARCNCDSGYEISADRRSCISCPSGYYRALGGSEKCQKCPANTTTSASGVAQCECLPGFFRAPSEGPESACTAPPGPPSGLQVILVTNTTIELTWNCPPDTGRDDTFYTICYYSALSIEDTICTDSIPQTSCPAIYTIDKLLPFSTYFVSVSSSNGVSSQDPTNAFRREASILGYTTEGVPDSPFLKRLCTVVIWKPPVRPAGIITAYELCFGSCSTGNLKCYNVSANDNFFLTSDAERVANVDVMIRARNSLYNSPWTECLPIGCSNFQQCTSSPSTTPSTSPPPPPTTPSTSPPPPPTTPSTSPPPPPTTPSTPPTPPPTIPSTPPTPPPTTPSPCPPTTPSTPPTSVPACAIPPIEFRLQATALPSGSSLNVSEIGEGGNALLCWTPNQNCCKANRLGEFFLPSGASVALKKDGKDLYRNRGTQLIRLNHRHNAVSPPTPGCYSCCLPDGCDDNKCIYINLFE